MGWTWYFPSVVEKSTVPMREDNTEIYVEHDDCIYLAFEKFHSENATNTLLGDVIYVVVQNFNL